MQDSFSPTQLRIIRQAITGVALLVLAMLIWGVLRSLIHFLSAFSGVLLPLATAGVLSLLLRPLYQRLHGRHRLPEGLSVALILLLLLLPSLLIFGVFGGVLWRQINQLLLQVPVWLDQLRVWATENAPALREWMERLGGEEKLAGWARQQSDLALQLAAGGLQGLLTVLGRLGGLLAWAVMPVYLVFLLVAPPFRIEKLEEFLPFLPPSQRADVLFLVRQFVEIVVLFFRGQLLIAFLQGLLMAVGFTLCGLSYGFLLGLLFGLLNLVPYLGNLVGLSVTLPLAWFQPGGGLGVLLGVVGVLTVVQCLESYVLTPRIMGRSTGLHPMAVIFAMFFWGQVIGGVLGLILAVPLTAFLVVFWRLLRDKYLPRLVATPPATD